MKSNLLLILLLMLAVTVNAQKKGKEAEATAPAIVKPSPELELKIYTTALKYGDIEVARNAMFSLLAKHPDSLCYLDTLARLYFSGGNYVQCALSAKDYLTKDTSNLFVREMLAISYSSLNKSKESLEQYELLYASTKSVYHAYQIAILQYVLKRYGECETTLDAILKDSKSAEEKISINVDQNSSQQVPIKAAAFNIKGVMNKELNKPDDAKANFQDALKVFPDFALAKANIEALNKPKTSDKK